ncbi:uncharacterized protein LOC143035933 [Oratosquilla oratoria]|uniref:uncharacterized protein LOC143035933 n=1 Tax=Oratosquilla oratoria TaxID=337810 RepID=UPI003F760FCB
MKGCLMWMFLLSACVVTSVVTMPGTRPTVIFRKPLFPGQTGRVDAPGFHTGYPKVSPENILGDEGPFSRLNKPVPLPVTTKTTTVFAGTPTTKDVSVDAELVPTRKPTLRSDEESPGRGSYLPEATAQRDAGTLAAIVVSPNTTFVSRDILYTLNNGTSALENVSDSAVTLEDAATKPQNHVTTSKILVDTPMNITNLHKTASNAPRNLPKNAEIEPKYSEDDVATVHSVAGVDSSAPCKLLEIKVNASDPTFACFLVRLIVADEKCTGSWRLSLRERPSGSIKSSFTMKTNGSLLSHGLEYFYPYSWLEGEYEVTDFQVTSMPFWLSHKKYKPQPAISNEDDRIRVVINHMVPLEEVTYKMRACPCRNTPVGCTVANKTSELTFTISKKFCPASECSFRFEVIVYRRSCLGRRSKYIYDINRRDNENGLCFPFPDVITTNNGNNERAMSTPMIISLTVLASLLGIIGFIMMVLCAIRLRKETDKLMASGEQAAASPEGADAELGQKVEVLLVYKKWILDPRVVEALSQILEEHYNYQVNDLYDLRDSAKLANGLTWIERKIETSTVKLLFVMETARSSGPYEDDDLPECSHNASVNSASKSLTREEQWYRFVLRCLRDAQLICNYERVFVASFDMDGTDLDGTDLDVKSIFEATVDLDEESKQGVKVDSPSDEDIVKPMNSKDPLWFLVPNKRYDLRRHMGHLGHALQVRKDEIL